MRLIAALLTSLLCGPVVAQQVDGPPEPEAIPLDSGRSTGIVAVVNGDIVSRADVENRRRMFALSTGLVPTPEVLDRLTPQIVRQLIDEKLRLQEVQKRKIVVSDQDIAQAIGDVEARNGMPPGLLRQRLAAQSVAMRTLVDQVRAQIGWARVLRQELGDRVQLTEADVAEQERLFKEQTGQSEFRLAEIFVPIDSPTAGASAQKFADTVIGQLRAGAPFAVMAAQFSQSQTALQGGDLGWQAPNQLDPAVLRVASVMPVGAVSNPIKVPGGLSIITLRARREVGRDPATMLSVRQIVLPFSSRLDPQNPTAQQKQTLDEARRISGAVKDCDGMAAVQKERAPAGSPAPAATELRLETAPPGLRGVLERLALGKTTQPLVAEDGIAVITLCGRESRNLGVPSKDEITERLLSERAELTSRQLQRDLQRQAVIDRRV